MHGAAFIKKGNPLEESLTPCLFLLTSHLLTYSQTQRTAKKVRAIPFHAAKKAWRKSSDPRGLSMMRMANRILDKRTKRGIERRVKKGAESFSFLLGILVTFSPHVTFSPLVLLKLQFDICADKTIYQIGPTSYNNQERVRGQDLCKKGPHYSYHRINQMAKSKFSNGISAINEV